MATASRRQAIDPMFAPPVVLSSPPASAMPEIRVEPQGDGLFRVALPGGRHYCLQHLPEVATRDIPGGAVSVPLACR